MKPLAIAPVDASKYRPDIDGLRAIAVLSVTLYHFGVKQLGGGYVGVDVFFVISGFLITRLILEAQAAGTFTFGNFYLRRVRRLFPAMLFTIFASVALGMWMFSPAHFERLGGSALHGLLSIANFFFWQESGYFDADSAVKPLLHLWSLAVEEQFYLIWPLTLVLLCKIKGREIVLPLAFAVFGFASWYYSQWYLGVDRSGAFYLLPSRIFEFCLGAILVPCLRWQLPNWLREIALIVGLCMIGYASLVFTKETLFPGTNALIPCVGTSLAILGGNARWSGAVLRNRFMVFTGLISYSLYLCHWPLYVFYTYYFGGETLTVLQIAMLVAAAYLIATFMYRCIERPLRFGKTGEDATLSSTRFALSCALISLVMAYTSAHVWANKGWFWRFESERDVEAVFDLGQRRIETLDYFNEHMAGATFRGVKKRILVVGDSHSRDVANGLHQVLADKNYKIRALMLDDACLKLIDPSKDTLAEPTRPAEAQCEAEVSRYRKSAKSATADVIVYSANLSQESAGHIENFVGLANRVSKNPAARILVFDRAVDFRRFHDRAVAEFARGEEISELNRLAAEVDKAPVFIDSMRVALDRPEFANVSVASKRQYQCSQQSCDFFTREGNLAIWDSTHWTLEGAALFMGRFVDDNPDWFK